jgi:dihydrofolate synthase/folylpolyglutamate synthase
VAATVWPGRLECIPYQERSFLLDGAHNPAGARALVKSLGDLLTDKIIVVFGAARDKDLKKMLAPLSEIAHTFILTQAVLSARAADPHDLATLVPQGIMAANPQEALGKALELSRPGEIILVAGSLYLLGEFRPLLLGQKGEAWERYQ